MTDQYIYCGICKSRLNVRTNATYAYKDAAGNELRICGWCWRRELVGLANRRAERILKARGRPKE